MIDLDFNSNLLDEILSLDLTSGIPFGSEQDSDLIQGNNCANFCENEKSVQELVSYFDKSVYEDEEKVKGIIEYFSRKYDYDRGKLTRVIKRLSRKSKCGTRGYVGYVKNLNSGDFHLEYFPIGCGCESCSYCSMKKRREFFRRISQKLEYYIEQGEEIDFFTITYCRVESEKLNDVYEDFTKKLRKIYSYKLGKKKLRKWKEEAYKELEKYLLNVKNEKEKERKKLRHKYLIEESFQRLWEAYNNGARRLYEVFPYMFLKIEITYREGSFHVHAHGVTVKTLSRFVWLSLLKNLGFGMIFDIRRVKDTKRIINYLTKYILKTDNIKFDNLKDEIIYEYVTYSRRKIREWGGNDFIEKEKEEVEEEIVYVLDLQLNMKLRCHISRLNKIGIRFIGGEFEYRGEKYYMFVDEEGKFVLDEKFFKIIYDDIMMDTFKVLYKFTRKKKLIEKPGEGGKGKKLIAVM